jgi:hypothetical protein
MRLLRRFPALWALWGKPIPDGKYESVNCPVCGTMGSEGTPSEIVLFFRVKCRIPKDQKVVSMFCEACEHAFFHPAPTKAQLNNYYERGYNDWFHIQERLAFEPGFAKFINEVENPHSKHWQMRWAVYRDGFESFPDFTGTLIDFGGNDGSLTRRLFPHASNITVVDIGYGGDLVGLLKSCDFLFAAHIFEHVSDPFDILNSLSIHLKSGCHIWLEVPQQYHGKLSDRWHKIKSGIAPIDPVALMHEHIQHFSERSLETLVTRNNFRVIKKTIFPGEIMGVLGQKI